MQLPKLPKPKENLKEGYSKNVLKNYAIRASMLALEANSVDWQSITKDEILSLIPSGEQDVDKFIQFANKVDRKLMEINTWHL